VALAARGYEVTGVDLSPHMLRITAKKLDHHGLSAELVRADMCRVNMPGVLGGRRFDAAICMFSTLGLVKGGAARKRALRAWRGLLEPGGVLVAHAHNLWHNVTDSWGRRWLARSAVSALVPGRQLGDKRMKCYRGLDGLYLHIFSLGELRRLLRSAGFEPTRELLLNSSRTGPFQGRLAYFRANGFIISARAG
jgi:ubiquinone/menaquinone biosynthesis C-methylase UbiE